MRTFESIVLKENSGSHRKDMKIKVLSLILCFHTMSIISLLLFFISQQLTCFHCIDIQRSNSMGQVTCVQKS